MAPEICAINIVATPCIIAVPSMSSIGTAGVPGVGLIMLAMVLNAVDLNPAAIGIILGIDRLLDMTRTSVNITGDAACAFLYLYLIKVDVNVNFLI